MLYHKLYHIKSPCLILKSTFLNTAHVAFALSGQAVADGLKNVAQHHIRSEAGTGHGSQLVLCFHTCMCIHIPKKVMNNHNENTKSTISISEISQFYVYIGYTSVICGKTSLLTQKHPRQQALSLLWRQDGLEIC